MNEPFDKKMVKDATLWVLAHERGLDSDQQRAFEEWLARDPKHKECFLEHQSCWMGLDFMQFWTPQASEDPDPDLFVKGDQSRLRRWLPYSALAACIAFVIFGYFNVPANNSDTPEDLAYHSNSFAGSKRHFLPDGSSFYLKENSLIEVNYGRNFRNINLKQGEAIFEVAHDKKRPFVVATNNAKVVALGTVFAVNSNQGMFEVYVTEGRVRLDSSGPSAGAASQGNLIPELKAGNKAVLLDSTPEKQVKPIPFTPDEYESKTNWKEEIIDLVSAPLSEIVRQFNLRSEIRIHISDKKLQSMRMSVTVSSENQQEFLNLLAMTSNIHIESTDDGIYIIPEK